MDIPNPLRRAHSDMGCVLIPNPLRRRQHHLKWGLAHAEHAPRRTWTAVSGKLGAASQSDSMAATFQPSSTQPITLERAVMHTRNGGHPRAVIFRGMNGHECHEYVPSEMDSCC